MASLRPASRRGAAAPTAPFLVALSVAAALAFAACAGATPAPTAATPAAATPAAATAAAAPSAGAACRVPAQPTPAQTEGPYFEAGSPERSSLVDAGMAGTRLTLAGLVLTTGCAPVPDAVVDVWQADADGVYDNAGYRLRGHVRTDATGRFVIETILPGEYRGRTEHIHVKVTPPGGATLTTQLYLPDNPANLRDSIFDPRLVVDLAAGGDPRTGRFTFILGS